MMKTLNKSKKRAINCGDGRFFGRSSSVSICLPSCWRCWLCSRLSVPSVMDLSVEVVGEAEILATRLTYIAVNRWDPGSDLLFGAARLL